DLDHVDLLLAGRLENDVKLGLLFSCGSRCARSRCRHGNGSRCRDAPLVFKFFDERGDLHDGEVAEVVDDLFFGDVSHDVEILESNGMRDVWSRCGSQARTQLSPPSLSFLALRTLRMP